MARKSNGNTSGAEKPGQAYGQMSGEGYTSIAANQPPYSQGTHPGGVSNWIVIGGVPGGEPGGKLGSKPKV